MSFFYLSRHHQFFRVSFREILGQGMSPFPGCPSNKMMMKTLMSNVRILTPRRSGVVLQATAKILFGSRSVITLTGTKEVRSERPNAPILSKRDHRLQILGSGAVGE